MQIVLHISVGTVVRQAVKSGDKLLCGVTHLVASVKPRTFGNHVLPYLGKGVKLGLNLCIFTLMCTRNVCGCEHVLCVVSHAVE